MSAIGDLVMFKDGTSINGLVNVKQFTIKTKYGTLKLKKKDIFTIHYKNPPQFLVDEMQLGAGTRLEGEILPSIIPIRPEGFNQTLNVSKNDIGTLVFYTGARQSISKAITKQLQKLK